MRYSKWLKWQIGGGVVCSLALVFNTVKADPAFQKAHELANQTPDSSDVTADSENTVAMEDWHQQEDKAAPPVPPSTESQKPASQTAAKKQAHTTEKAASHIHQSAAKTASNSTEKAVGHTPEKTVTASHPASSSAGTALKPPVKETPPPPPPAPVPVQDTPPSDSGQVTQADHSAASDRSADQPVEKPRSHTKTRRS